MRLAAKLRRDLGDLASRPEPDAEALTLVGRSCREVSPELELLRRIAGEGVSLQARAEVVIRAVQEGRPLGEVAGKGGPLVRSLFALEEQLPQSADPEVRRYVTRIRAILRYDAELVFQSLELLALTALGSPRLEEQRRKLDGLGAPAAELRQLEDQLKHLRSR
jgi:hypothetical protein